MIKTILIPSDPKVFKQKLLVTKRARRTLTYKDGSMRVEIWKADRFTSKSNLMGNISSQLLHRRDKSQIVEAKYEIIEEIDFRECDEKPDDRSLSRLYINYEKGWLSFRPTDKHVTGYIIEDNVATVFYSVGFIAAKSESKTISQNDMRELYAILNKAVRYGMFEDSDTGGRTVHGYICTYEYSYCGQSGSKCRALFKDDYLNNLYNDLINRIIY